MVPIGAFVRLSSTLFNGFASLEGVISFKKDLRRQFAIAEHVKQQVLRSAVSSEDLPHIFSRSTYQPL